jgi:hypothetical protein
MLPAEEYMHLKRKYDTEKAAGLKGAKIKQQRSFDYDAAAFANAMHGMPPLMMHKAPPRQDSYFRIKADKSAKPQPKHTNKKNCEQVAVPQRRPGPMFKDPPAAQRARYMKKPLPRPDYSNPYVRENYAYKPPVLSGKAGEVLGVTNKRDYTGKSAPAYNKKDTKETAKRAIKNVPKTVKGYGPAKKKSTGCVVM